MPLRFPRVLDVAVVALLAVLPYLCTLGGGFVLDDERAIVYNPSVTGPAGNPSLSADAVWDLLSRDFWGTPIRSSASHKSYRPLTVMSFRLTGLLFSGGTSSPSFPVALHATNIALNAAASTAALLFLWGSETPIVTSRLAQLCCAAVFAVHPLHTENIASLVGRADVLCFLFMLLCAHLYLRAASAPAATACLSFTAALGCFGVATLFKELGITSLVLCAGLDTVLTLAKPLSRGALWRWVLRTALAACASAAALAASSWVRGSSLSPRMSFEDNPINFNPDAWERALHYLYVHTWYAYLLVLPTVSCSDWGHDVIPLPSHAEAGAAVAALYAALSLPVLLFLRSVWRGRAVGGPAGAIDRVVAALVFLVVPFVPASGVVPVGTVLAERLLFVPSLGYAMLCGIAFEAVERAAYSSSSGVAPPPQPDEAQASAVGKRPSAGLRRRQGGGRGGAGAAGGAPVTEGQVQRGPPGWFMLFCVVVSLAVVGAAHVTSQRAEDWTDPLRLYTRTAAHCPGSAKTQLALGSLAMQRNDPKTAVPHFQRAVEIYPKYVDALVALGRIASQGGDLEKGKEVLRHALSLDPKNHDALHYLGMTVAQLGDLKGAAAMLRQAVLLHDKKLLPPSADLLQNYATALAMQAEDEPKREALAAFRRAISLGGIPRDMCHRYRNYVAHQLAVGDLEHFEPSLQYLKGRCHTWVLDTDLTHYEREYAKAKGGGRGGGK